jgi:hypothetical protein
MGDPKASSYEFKSGEYLTKYIIYIWGIQKQVLMNIKTSSSCIEDATLPKAPIGTKYMKMRIIAKHVPKCL